MVNKIKDSSTKSNKIKKFTEGPHVLIFDFLRLFKWQRRPFEDLGKENLLERVRELTGKSNKYPNHTVCTMILL